ncbi:MAG: threonine synthase [Candidatus Sumerlaeaceae bacterium]
MAVTALTCTICDKNYEADYRLTCPDCGPADGILDVGYDYDFARKHMTRESLATRALDHWRYRELLPIQDGQRLPTLHVGYTPVYRAQPLEKHYGIAELYLKDDGRNPTASFKDRASSMGVAKALEFGYNTVACASTGNAASSLAGMAANVGLRSFIFVPQRAPQPKVTQLLVFGANVIRVQGTYDQAYDLCMQAAAHYDWYQRNCAVNSYLVEGKKTCGLEIAEQMADNLPDWVVMSVGDGCSIAGVWKGLREMHELGLIDRVPRMLGVQAEGSPAVKRQFQRSGEPPLGVYPAETIADSICVGVPRNWRKAVRAVRESHGEYVTVTDHEIMQALRTVPQLTGVFAEPAASASVAGVTVARELGVISPSDKVLVVVTGNGLKDIKSASEAVGQPFDIEPNMEALAAVVEGGRVR